MTELNYFPLPQGKLVYEVIGDLSAPTYFQVDKDTGLISVKTSLSPDNTPQYVVSFNIFIYLHPYIAQLQLEIAIFFILKNNEYIHFCI